MNAASSSALYCILPPHILKYIAKNGTAAQRSRAIDALTTAHSLRSLRSTRAMTLLQVPRRLAAIAEAPQKHRTIFDAHGTQDFPGTVVRREETPASGDPAIDEAYDGLGHTFDFYWNVFQRNSIDGHGLALNATVHIDPSFQNAQWDGERMLFADGDGELFNRFTIALDVIGHELTHGVTQYEANLVYLNQAGALNESMSDVFGIMIKQKVLNQTADQADWLIGEGLLAARVHGRALRSMKEPGTAYDDSTLGKDPQPPDMAHYDNTMDDSGGVHINSGIPNRAFFLAASAIGGYAWEKAGRVWYATLHDPRLRSDADFQRFATLTIDNAGQLFGDGVAGKAVSDAWAQVGVLK
jgi:Zn-dependent metalloprotease